MAEKTVAMVRGEDFEELLECPRRCWMGCNTAMDNPPGFMFDNDQDVEQPECCRHGNPGYRQGRS